MEKGTYKEVKLHARTRPSVQSQDCIKEVPWLNVSGVWLAKLGFNIGDTVRIIMRDRLLVIEPLESAEEEQRAYKNTLDAMRSTLKKML